MFYSKGELLSAYFLNIFSNIIYDQFSQNCPGPDSSVMIKSMTEVNLSISNTLMFNYQPLRVLFNNLN